MPPNLTEIATTTLRNRSTGKKMKPKEGSPKEQREDARLAKQHGMTMKQWEGSPQDRRHDIRKAVKSAVASAKGKAK